MKIRLGIFVISLLLLPLAGFLLSGAEWIELPACCLAGDTLAENENFRATLLTALVLLGCILLINHTLKLRIGTNPLATQRIYFLAMGVTSAVLGWLMSYLNLFVANWSVEQGDSVAHILIITLLFGLLIPFALSIRALIGSFTGLLKFLAHGIALPTGGNETLVFCFLPVAVLGLLGGAAWPAKLFWLLWLAPLLLLVSLQLFWNESTIFAGLKSGDWGRAICAALSGLVAGNIAVIGYQVVGGSLQINFPHPMFTQLGYVVFGLLSVQLGDVIAENWRGKKRGESHRQNKKFPVAVVVKKN